MYTVYVSLFVYLILHVFLHASFMYLFITVYAMCRYVLQRMCITAYIYLRMCLYCVRKCMPVHL